MAEFAARRRVLGALGTAGAGILAGGLSRAAAADDVDATRGDILDVRRFGARGDGKSDDTAAFQKALDAAGARGGATVRAPAGNYLFAGHLFFPRGVTLVGDWISVPSHNGLREDAAPGLPVPTGGGTTLLVTENAGKEDGSPFLNLAHNCTLRGVVLYYPDQVRDAEPVSYPWAISMRGENAAVLDVELLNPYRGINATLAPRHLIRNVVGQPLRLGIWLDEIYDTSRLENVHFNPWWTFQSEAYQWQLANGEAFVFGKSDWLYAVNTFCYGYNIGYRFIATKAGSCNGNFLGIGADDCNSCLWIDQASKYGLLITNGEFVSLQGPDPTALVVTGEHSGSVRLVNCAFWGKTLNQAARLDGRGTVGLSDCTFVQWAAKGDGRPAVQGLGGTVLVRGCEFQHDAPQIEIGPGVRRAIVTDNVVAGAVRISVQSQGRVALGQNLGTA